jgi:hypothetical protein
MLTMLSQTTTTDGDKVTLHMHDETGPAPLFPDGPSMFDGFRRRLVFSVEGRNVSGYGAVGGHVEWYSPSGSLNIEPWDADAVPRLDLWADADPFVGVGDPEPYEPITVRGVAYQFGYTWRETGRAADPDPWIMPYVGLRRADGGKITDAGRARMHHILTAARDLFLALPDMRAELARRSLAGARDRQIRAAQVAMDHVDLLNRRIAAL